MIGSKNSIKGGVVFTDPTNLSIQRVVALQYNPHTVTRTLTPAGSGAGESESDSTEALRLSGPARETIKLEAELDAADQLDQGNPIAATLGVQPQIAALEMIVNPSVAQVMGSMLMEQQGFMEILPMESPLTLFVWSAHRVVPVRITEFSVTEEMFDSELHPIRAKVSLGMRVLTFDDLGFAHKGGGLYFGHLVQKEILSAIGSTGTTSDLGIGDVL